MKTKIYQVFTVVSFFTLSITSTLAVSWGMNDLMFSADSHQTNAKTIVYKQTKTNDLCKSLKMLIPKL